MRVTASILALGCIALVRAQDDVADAAASASSAAESVAESVTSSAADLPTFTVCDFGMDHPLWRTELTFYSPQR